MQHLITLPDGSKRKINVGLTYFDLAKEIGPGLAKAALAVKSGDNVLDLTRVIEADAQVEFITASNEDGLEVIRHSTAHVLAMAVQKLWPKTKVTIGPVIKDGFYYDFDFPEDVKLGEKDLQTLEETMTAIIKEKLEIVREELSKEKAIELFSSLGETYKVELINSFDPKDSITIYKMGNWFDLCRGPHVKNTASLGVFKLTSIAGAYWKGNAENKMLTRVYGTAWGDKKELKDYLYRIEEAKKRDHRVLGKQLDLFTFHDEAPANAFFHEKGAYLYQKLISYARRVNDKFGFKEVNTPLVMNVDLWHKSGHYDNYKENMYFTKVDEMDAAVKPMNCPGHCLIYGSRKRSYRELPVKMSEFGRVHRHEKSGVINGLFRVRSFVQDDAHIFCAVSDLQDMIKMVLSQIDEIYHGLGFTQYKMELSTRPAKSIGSDEVWAQAEQALETALKATGRPYKLNPGDGAFYGPKIDFHLVDALGRTWQCGTVQVDFSMPERFGLEYVGKENRAERPVMIHRAVLGSIERFLGIFIEHHAGHFPLWISPVQVVIINITDAQEEYAQKIAAELRSQGIRIELDLRREKLGYKIRDAQLAKIPYMLVLGAKEMESQTISPRFRDGTQLEGISIESFIARLKEECGALYTL